jgi:Tol biopolymer transport system component
MMRIRRVSLAIFASAFVISGTAADFPIKKFGPFTWVVDYEASWSPDSRQIVLISSRHGGMKVHVMNADSASHGSDMRQLTFGSDEDDSPAWSPDGKKIAFVSIRAGVSQIFVMNADGTNIRQLTNGNAENIHPTWAPDSQRILFNTTKFVGATAADGRDVPSDNKVIGEQIDKKTDLATIRVDGTDLKRLTTGGGCTYASFSPDGLSILHRRVVGAKSQIFLMNADTTDDHNISGENTLDGWPAWSNDGKRVVFSRRVNDRFQLFVMNRDGSGAVQLTDAAGEFVNPHWSPDGAKIMCARRLGDINVVIFPAPK